MFQWAFRDRRRRDDRQLARRRRAPIGGAGDLPPIEHMEARLLLSSAVVSVDAPVANGPKVRAVRHFKFQNEPLALMVTFNKALNTFRALNPSNYTLVPVNVNGNPIGSPIALRNVVYHAGQHSVVLTFESPIMPKQGYQLTINGQAPNGLTDRGGRLLDGNGLGGQGTSWIGDLII